MSRTYDRLIEEIQRRRFFDNHHIEKRGPTTWRCRVQGEGGINAFYVTTQPGAIIMWGDLGELIFTIYGAPNAFHWGRRNFRRTDTYYPFTKLALDMRDKRFSTEDATDYLKERVEEAKTSSVLDAEDLARAEKMLKTWEIRCGNEPHEDEAEWWRLWSEFDDPDAPDMRDWKPRIYWCFFCLCWFFSHVSADDPRFSEAWNA
jgi:hypothetical protein